MATLGSYGYETDKLTEIYKLTETDKLTEIRAENLQSQINSVWDAENLF